MARPIKQGLDYFPLDVDIDQDDKVAMIEADFGIEGFGIVIKLLTKVYKEGYFYEWTEREQKLFSKRVNVDINTVKEVVNGCINEGIFNKKVYEKHNVLTSKGIQKRYIEAIKRRSKVEFYKQFFLVDDVDSIIGGNKINVLMIDVNDNSDSKVVNVNINHHSTDINDNISTQRKGKERKEENSSIQQVELFESWWNLYGNKKGKVKCESKYKSLLKKHNHESIMEGTHNYLKNREILSAKGEFVPQQKNPLTFLNGEHFNDEYDYLESMHIAQRPVETVLDINAGEDW